MKYVVNLTGDASNYTGKYVTLNFVCGKYEGEISKPDVLAYLRKMGHVVEPAEVVPSAPKKTPKKKGV